MCHRYTFTNWDSSYTSDDDGHSRITISTARSKSMALVHYVANAHERIGGRLSFDMAFSDGK
jgi:hypothetical protein